MGNAKLEMKRTRKNGKEVTYTYNKIGGVSLSTYMYEKLKERRQLKRLENGKILAREVPQFLIDEMIHEHDVFNATYAQLARKYALSRYIVAKVCSQQQTQKPS